MKNTTKTYYLILLFIATMGILLPQATFAQKQILVSGRVLDKETKKPFRDMAVFIYAYNTVAEATDALRKINDPLQSAININADATEGTDQSGNYEIHVAETGALIFKVDMADAVMEKVNMRMEINVSIDAGHVLGEVSVTGTLQDIRPKPKAPTMIGNKLILYNTFPIPEKFGKPNARLIVQPYVMECMNDDTIGYGRPLVYDGVEYTQTQLRRMNYEKEHDPLLKYAEGNVLEDTRMNLDWSDTVVVPDPKLNYHATATVQLEDYTKPYYTRDMLINTCNMKRPFKFLEFKFGSKTLDPNKYRERAKREKRNTTGKISLTFLVGKAQLDPNNPENEIQMNKLKNDLLEIIHGEGTTLKEFDITGISSPEGQYAKNVQLSKERVQYAQSQIMAIIPSSMRARIYQNPTSEVAGWEEVARLLQDTMPMAAQEIKTIVSMNKNRDEQYKAIAKLPYYQSVIIPLLPRLRTVKYEYKHEIFRELQPEEILEKYNNDPDYHSGKKAFALYEYWHLFNMVKNTAELEDLYRRAYNESNEANGQPWILAANNLAVSYLKRDTFDINILDPFIDKRVKGVNIERKGYDGVSVKIINPEVIVANQLAMCVKANNYELASVMAQILPDTEEYLQMKAFALVLGGYYKGGNTQEEREQSRQAFNLVKESSPMNEVIMHLAMDSKVHDQMAEQAWDKLPKDDAKTWYLKAIIDTRKGESAYLDTQSDLVNCWKIDEKLIKTAQNDGEFEEAILKEYIEYYEDLKAMMQTEAESTSESNQETTTE